MCANGWIEVSVVCAALLGTVMGGFLVSPWAVTGVAAHSVSAWVSQVSSGALESAFLLSLVVVLLTCATASCLNLGIPGSGARYAPGPRSLRGMCTDFFRANRTLWRDRTGGLSLAVTTLLWGVGATLQFAVLRWAGDVLQVPLDKAAYLQVAVAVGALGGVLVVPLNALRQHRGGALLSAGRSIAVQGFNENASVLAMLAVYSALIAADLPIVPLLCGFGLLIAAAMGALLWQELRRANPPAC